MSKPLINPFNKSSYFYNKYETYIEYRKNYPIDTEYPEYPDLDSQYYNVLDNIPDDLPESLKADDTIPFSELPELDMSRNINTELIHNISIYPNEPKEYTSVETSLYDKYPRQNTLYRSAFKSYVSNPISHKTNLSNPMKKPSGRRPNMPLYDDEYHKNRREYAAYKKQLMYKSLTFPELLNLYGKLQQTKFYSKFENWLVANNIIDYETTKIYDQQYKLYKIINNEDILK